MQLPIEKILPELRSVFLRHYNVVLSADPGAGKTTRVPPALLNEPWLEGKKIIMLEPRRLAAKRAAEFMSKQLDERVGERVGYRIRGDHKVSPATRIEVVTEGVLTRMLQDDPALPDAAIVIFDEFHERSIHADLGLALTLDVQHHLRDELRILVMSATLDGIAISSLLNDAPVITSEGRTFPVDTLYLPQNNNGKIEPLVASAVLRSLRDDDGDILVFLPGQREIRRVESLLDESDLPPLVDVHLLYGEAPPEKQQAALASALKGRRKVILSTNVAETSLTIDGVRIVIDSGLSRAAKFDPRRGMSGLITIPVSHASADQRRGRAGRQQSGVCYRLWTEIQHSQLPKFSQPEIVSADLASFALELTLWGDPEGTSLKFLDQPPISHFSQARSLLKDLGVIDQEGKLTEHGKAVSRLGIHPRLAHMMIRGKELGMGALACDVAALLEERDLLRGKGETDIDFSTRWKAMHGRSNADQFARERVLQQSKRLKMMIDASDRRSSDEHLGVLLALAYPERVAKRRSIHSGKYQLAGGAVGNLPKESSFSREEYLAVADVDGAGNEVKIFLAAPLTKETILETFAELIREEEEIRWDEKEGSVISRRVVRFGAIELAVQKFEAGPEKVGSIVLEAIRDLGVDVLPWNKESNSFRVRSEWLRTHTVVDSDWPDLSTEHLSATLEQWLGPYLGGITRRDHFRKLDMAAIVHSLFSYRQLQELDRLVPTHITVPTGSRISVDYSTGEQPILAVRLQEMFGEIKTPAIVGGKVKVLLHLLSPAHRPLAVTQDLPSFWKNAYPDVRKDMRGQYPKHVWPEDPLTAAPTKRTKRYSS